MKDKALDEMLQAIYSAPAKHIEIAKVEVEDGMCYAFDKDGNLAMRCSEKFIREFSRRQRRAHITDAP